MARELQCSFEGSSGNLYATVRRDADAFGADVVASAFEAWDDASIGDYDIVLTNRGGDHYDADFPTWVIPGTRCTVRYYERVGATPAITDTILKTEHVVWTGAGLSTSPSATHWGTREGAEVKAGDDNLFIYADKENGTSADAPTVIEVAAEIEDLFVEAAADMRVAWRKYSGGVPLGYLLDWEHRWLDDTNEYGAIVKAYQGRRVGGSGQFNPNELPSEIATAFREWEQRLQLLRDGDVLQDYYEDESDTDAATNLGIPTVAKSDGTAVEADDLPVTYASRPYALPVWP